MQSLKVKKFFIDYLIGTGVVFLLFYLLIGNITVMDTRPSIKLSHECSSPFSPEEVLDSILPSLREGESCEFDSPCVEEQILRCEGTVRMSALYKTFFWGDLLLHRVKETPVKSYGFSYSRDSSTFRVPLSFILLFIGYGIVLVETGVLVFALWRQNNLKQTFTLPPGDRKDQIIRPAVFAILFALVVVLMNYLVFTLFEHPEVEGREIISTLLKSVAGIFTIVILAPLAEEIICRGVLLRYFVERNKSLLGTILVSLLFSVLHGFLEPGLGWQLYISTIYFILSVFLCRLYITQKNIWSPIVFHSAYNSTMVVLYTLFS